MKVIEVPVTQQEIDLGIPISPDDCPLALACGKKDIHYVYVSEDSTTMGRTAKDSVVYHHDEVIRDWIEKFDDVRSEEDRQSIDPITVVYDPETEMAYHVNENS